VTTAGGAAVVGAADASVRFESTPATETTLLVVAVGEDSVDAADLVVVVRDSIDVADVVAVVEDPFPSLIDGVNSPSLVNLIGTEAWVVELTSEELIAIALNPTTVSELRK
jgi:hypothetical protein